ncbi:Rieske (2Fe-2S) protein [Paenibacillus thalictri]|uniref:Rieske (2Fe-2S) protein n=1 Tax=Paenibacillus thalictri TaxID=2527873 RepID=A0A4Q9DU15_9BACL|nr:Rieske (2Fe-2S) protein [Paenibacillus thalictri]TBL79350.1 Rieske (2Fe-2S) protein [Paenibacillus thalictri]
MSRHIIGKASDLPPGERTIVTAENRSIGVFNVNGTYYALRNSCPHQGAPLCKGHVTGMTLAAPPGQYRYGRQDEILRCPWHGWEFDLTSGKSIYDPHRCLVKTYDVTVERTQAAAGAPEPVAAGPAAEGGAVQTAAASDPDGEEARVDTYPVTVEDGWIVVHV